MRRGGLVSCRSQPGSSPLYPLLAAPAESAGTPSLLDPISSKCHSNRSWGVHRQELDQLISLPVGTFTYLPSGVNSLYFRNKFMLFWEGDTTHAEQQVKFLQALVETGPVMKRKAPRVGEESPHGGQRAIRRQGRPSVCSAPLSVPPAHDVLMKARTAQCKHQRRAVWGGGDGTLGCHNGPVFHLGGTKIESPLALLLLNSKGRLVWDV